MPKSKCRDIVRNVNIDNMSIQKYLVTEDLSKEEKQLLFSLRSRSFPVKCNSRYLFEDMSCRACKEPQHEESEIHFAQTCVTFESERECEMLNVEDIFGPIQKQITFIRSFKIIARKWKLILEVQ